MSDTISKDSIISITSIDPENHKFGTGFVVYKNQGLAYLLTCTHVVRDVGGSEKIKAGPYPAKIVISEERSDITVLQVEGFADVPAIKLGVLGEREKRFVVTGYGRETKDTDFVIRPIHGVLGEQIQFDSPSTQKRVTAWDLQINDKFSELKPGYSGSPVYDESEGITFAIASHSQIDGKKGRAICISNLFKVWTEMPPGLLAKPITDTGILSNYQYDVFLSYNSDYSGPWVEKYFYEALVWALQEMLNRPPEIFLAKHTPNSKNVLPSDYKAALSRSRCVVPIWSPSYFRSYGFRFECSFVRHREHLMGFRSEKNPLGLLLPALINDGKYISSYLEGIRYHDFRKYINPFKCFEESKLYFEFYHEVEKWGVVIADVIAQVPPLKSEWIDPDFPMLPEYPIPPCPLPGLR